MEPGFARSQSSNPPHPFNRRFYLPSPHLISIWRRKPGSFRYWLWLPPSLRQLWGQIMWSPLWFFPLHYVPGDIPCLLTQPMGAPGGSVINGPLTNAGDSGDVHLTPGSGKSPGEGNGILLWRIPWTEEPGRPWSIGSQKVAYDWSD